LGLSELIRKFVAETTPLKQLKHVYIYE